MKERDSALIDLRVLEAGASLDIGDEGRVTPAPWHTEPDAETSGYLTNINHRGDGRKSALHEHVGSTISEADAVLIAATRNALPYLLDVVEAARAMVANQQAGFGLGDGQWLKATLDALDAHLRSERLWTALG